jgi:hypothetical protein
MEELGHEIGSRMGHPSKALMGKTSLLPDESSSEKLVN